MWRKKDRADSQAGHRAGGRFSERSDERTIGRADEPTNDRAARRSLGQSDGRAGDLTEGAVGRADDRKDRNSRAGERSAVRAM